MLNMKLNDLHVVIGNRVIVSCFVKDGLYQVLNRVEDCVMKFTNPKEALKFIAESMERVTLE